jgi:hypothetical protein
MNFMAAQIVRLLGEKIRTFPKDSNGMSPPEATVRYQGHDCSYAELLEDFDLLVASFHL